MDRGIENLEEEAKVDNKTSVKQTKFPVLGVLISFILAIAITFFSANNVLSRTKMPIEAYRVYLKGSSIGLIKSEDELNEYINKMQQAIKAKYNVNKVYIPNDINVIKDITYEENIKSIKEIYDIINKESPFTIKGYIATIDKTNSTEYVDDTEEEIVAGETKEKPKIIKINILDKDLFFNSAKKVILSFVTEDEYNNYSNETQSPIVDTGEIIENLYIEDYITFTDAYIPVNEKIYTDEDELTSYLLFGSDNNMSTYTVKSGDTIASIAEANKMNVNEMLIANSNLGSATALLYEGQKLTVGVLNPIFTTIEETHKVEDQTISYKTEYIYDNSQLVGYQKVQTKGSNGVTRVTQKIKTINGEISQAVIANKEEIKPVVNEVIIKGGKKPVIVSAGNWGWPTNIPYIITSPYGWRWGRLHRGVDISGTGYGSPIYAAKAGVVVDVKYGSAFGNYVTINHQNGYYTRYEHMASLSRYVKEGQYVEMGTTIGDMGNSGASQGTHLHFEIWDGYPYRSGSNSYNPLLFY